MKIWLVKIGEPTPHDKNGSERLLRTGILAKVLSQRGHDVLWWTSTFDHHNHSQRFDSDTRYPVSEKFNIQYIRSRGYKTNLSLSRVLDHYFLSQSMIGFIENNEENKPDLIVVSFPIPELALNFTRYGLKHGIPVLVDIRDLWPDVFFDTIPSILHPLISLCTLPVKRAIKEAFTNATGIIGLTREFLSWGLDYCARDISSFDAVFPMGYISQEISNATLKSSPNFWHDLGISKNSQELLVVFFGALGRTNNLLPVIESARIIMKKKRNVKFVICGSGEKSSYLQKMASDLDNVYFPGRVNSLQIQTLLDIADIGIAPYINSINYVNNIPNKPAEYLSGGLLIALSLDHGAMYDLITKHQCGFSYQDNSTKLASELISFMDNRELLKQAKQNSIHLFTNELDGRVTYNKMVDFLESVVQRSNNNNQI